MLQLLVGSPWLLCIQDPGYIQLVVQNSLCEKLVLSHMPDQPVQYEMKKHLVPLISVEHPYENNDVPFANGFHEASSS